MAKHFALLTQFQTVTTKVNDKLTEEDKHIILRMLVHAPDIGGPTLPFALLYELALRVHQEFHDQYLSESLLNL